MGHSLSSMLRKYYSSFSNWRASEVKEEDAESQRQFEKDLLTIVDDGDLEGLSHLSQYNRFMFWDAIELLKASSPLLHHAAHKCHLKIIEFLLDFGMDVDETDSSGMTALHIACKNKSQDNNSCVALLLACCRDLDKKDVWGRTPLIKALVYRNLDAAEMLLKKGANPNATDIYGMTPLSTAIDYDLMDILRCLVSYGADVNLITQHPYRISGPPLYLAINNQNLSMVNELLKLGATTEPRLQDYVGGAPSSVQGRWQYLSFHSPNNVAPPSSHPILQHGNAVALAMSELLKRGEENLLDISVDVLMAVLAAHGYSLGSSQEVLIRVLVNASPKNFTMMLYKLQVCSSCCSEEMTAAMLSLQGQESRNGPANIQQLSQGLRKPPRLVSSLQNQARRTARQALMASRHNVVWACGHLQCPPALKSLMLLKDIDRAFAPPRCLSLSNPA